LTWIIGVRTEKILPEGVLLEKMTASIVKNAVSLEKTSDHADLTGTKVTIGKLDGNRATGKDFALEVTNPVI
jgi:hypothetical protein